MQAILNRCYNSPVALSKNYPLRLPPDLWEKIQALAFAQDRSANWVILDLIRKGLAATDQPKTEKQEAG